MIRLTVTFDDQTGRTLFKLAHREMRNPRDQVVYMIKQALAAMENQPETNSTILPPCPSPNSHPSPASSVSPRLSASIASTPNDAGDSTSRGQVCESPSRSKVACGFVAGTSDRSDTSATWKSTTARSCSAGAYCATRRISLASWSMTCVICLT